MNPKLKFFLIIGLIILFLIIIFIPKQYATSEGFAGFPKDKECQCIGIKFDYAPENIADAMTSYYCAGIPISCKCLDEKRC